METNQLGIGADKRQQ